MWRTVALPAAVVALALPQVLRADDLTPEEAYVNSVIDALVRKGLLTEQDADEIKSDATQAAEIVASGQKLPSRKWTDWLKIGGYVQSRWQYYPDAAHGDPDNELLVRRARTAFAFTPTPRTEVYIQPDFGEGSAEIRDAWAQYAVGSQMEGRFRFGQQKIPFGFETPQSSGTRLPLERNWLARREFPGERDTGVVFLYTHSEDRELFDNAKKHDWGTGDYGNIAIGFLNGQGLNTDDANNGKHLILRYAKPFEVGKGRYAEVGTSYWTGTYYSDVAMKDFSDRLWGIHGHLSPHPLGLQAEYYTGHTEGGDLDGWYAMGIWRACTDGTFFTRYDDYNGTRKGNGLDEHCLPKPYDRHRTSIGYAHMLDSNTELTLEYDVERLDAPPGGSNDLFGLQLQVSY
jgi:hypothetical protein